MIKINKLILTSLIFLGVIVAATAVHSDSKFHYGLQHLYPYYDPGFTESDQQALSSYLQLNLPANLTSPQKINYFGNNYLATNELGSIALSTAIYSVSRANPQYNENNRCGLIGWQCDGSRWRSLNSFTEANNLEPLSLEGQLMFINKELNGLSLTLNNDQETQAAGFNQDFKSAFDVLQTGTNLEAMFTALKQYMALDDSLNLISIAQNNLSYDPTKTYNAKAQSPKYVALNTGFISPDAGDCSSGLARGYIATTNASDAEGRLLRYSNKGKNYVHRCIFEVSEKLLDDYHKSTGHTLRFWGWRSHARQIELRSINGCVKVSKASSPVLYNYQLYLAGASELCDVPTARPGESNHQDGLALDFYCEDGAVKGSNCNNAFDWLKCYAASYGFVNLPSENWHWDYFTTTNRRKPASICN